MKKLMLIFLGLAAVMSAGFCGFAAEGAPSAKVIIYYFHGSFRCATCTAMEKYSREAVETNFKDALACGKLEFRAVNVEERGNEHFADDYKLYTKSVILSLVEDGREVKSRNLDKIWQLAGNRQKFVDYVAGEVAEFMKDAS